MKQGKQKLIILDLGLNPNFMCGLIAYEWKQEGCLQIVIYPLHILIDVIVELFCHFWSFNLF
jgi:hypothetical protein